MAEPNANTEYLQKLTDGRNKILVKSSEELARVLTNKLVTDFENDKVTIVLPDVPTMADILAKILEGNGISIDRSVAGQITINADNSGGTTIEEVIAKILPGTDISIDRSIDGQITINYTGIDNDTATNITTSDSYIQIGGSGFNRTINISEAALMNIIFGYYLNSTDGSIDITKLSDGYWSIAINQDKLVDLIEANLPEDNDTPTDITTSTRMITIGGSNFNRSIDIDDLALIDTIGLYMQSSNSSIDVRQYSSFIDFTIDLNWLSGWFNENYPTTGGGVTTQEVLDKILAGSNITINRNTAGQITISATNTATSLSSPDSSIDVGGSGFSRTVAINNSALLDKVFNMLQQGGSVEISKQDDLIVVSTPTLSFYSPDGSITGGFDANGLLQLTASQSTGVGTYDVVHKTSHIVENQAIAVMPNDPSFDPNNPFATITDADYVTIEGLDYGLTHAIPDPNDETKVLVNCCDIDIVVHFDKPVDADNFQFFDVKLMSNNTDIHVHEILSFASSELGIIGAVGQAKAFYIKARIIGSNKQTVDDNAIIYVKVAVMDVAGVTTTLNVIAPTHWLAHEWYAKQIPPDTTPLLVEWTEPENLSENVPLDQAITIDWNADIELNSSSNTIIQLGDITNGIERIIVDTDYSISGDKLILNIGQYLQGSSDYVIRILKDAFKRSNGQTNEYFEMFFKTEQEPAISFDVTVANDGDMFTLHVNSWQGGPIDWGDGIVTATPSRATNNPSHVYVTAGVYRLNMYGYYNYSINANNAMVTGELILNRGIIGTLVIFAGTNITTLTGKYNKELLSSWSRSPSFSSCSKLTTVDLPNVTRLYENAFNSCISLRTADLQSLQEMGGFTFAGCTSLERVWFGRRLGNTGSSNFYNAPTTNIDLELCSAEYALADLTNLTWRGYTWKSITERNS